VLIPKEVYFDLLIGKSAQHVSTDAQYFRLVLAEDFAVVLSSGFGALLWLLVFHWMVLRTNAPRCD
jgi:hypothetical protein